MTEEPFNLSEALGTLKTKSKPPNSARVLNAWIAQAEHNLGYDGGRLGWLVAATVVSAALQRVVDASGKSVFLIKGGTMLQYRLPDTSRATQDLDGLVRGSIDNFIEELDKSLAEPWGALTLVRDGIKTINTPDKIIKPRAFDIIVELKGITWRRIKVELSPDEGSAGSIQDELASPSLSGFGLPTPDHLAALAMQYQIAQKVHAATTPHNPPEFVNNRARDIIDLLLLRDLTAASGSPTEHEIRLAIEDIFSSRKAEAQKLARPTREWPAEAKAYPHWQNDYAKAASSAGITLPLEEAVNEVNTWLKQLAEA
jgi:hypothetical protein